MYKITLEGSRCASWDEASKNAGRTLQGDSGSLVDIAIRSSEDLSEAGGERLSLAEKRLRRKPSLTDRLQLERLDLGDGVQHHKDSHTVKMTQILEQTELRSAFREFLRANYCEENLSFWTEVQDFKKRFNTTSSAGAAPGMIDSRDGGRTVGHRAMEKHQQDLISMAFVIHNSQSEASLCHIYPSPC